MAVGFVHAPELAELKISCPQVPILDQCSDPNGNCVYIDDPNCNSPRTTIAIGKDATDIRNTNEIISGDVAELDLQETMKGMQRRRVMIDGYDPTDPVSLSTVTGSNTPTFKLKGVKAIISKGEQKEIFRGTPIELRTLVFILDFSSHPSSSCGTTSMFGPAVTPEAATVAMKDPKVSNNLKNYYEKCSYKKTKIDDANIYVVGPVSIPCKGWLLKNLTGRPVMPPRPPPKPPSQWASLLPLSRKNDTVDDWWDISLYCTASEQQAWEREAEKWARVRAITDPKLFAILNWPQRRRNIYVLPNALKCAWAGYADVTCTSPTCSVYVKGGVLGTGLQVFMHESMHNYGLEHASMGRDEYGDESDVMGNFRGAGSGLLCPNAPNMFRIGWAKPINPPGTVAAWLPKLSPELGFGNLTVDKMTSANNKRMGLILPAPGIRDDNFVVVDFGGEGRIASIAPKRVPWNTIFISYRVRNTTVGGYDSGVATKHHMKVLIHAYNGSQTERQFGQKSLLLDWGPKFQKAVTWDPTGSTWASSFVPITKGFYNGYDVGGGVVVTVKSVLPTQAVIDVCRQFEKLESSCNNGQDDDCDNLIDDEDPDCA
jgi:hypothetical protein